MYTQFKNKFTYEVPMNWKTRKKNVSYTKDI
jgi:hypothetical protein